MSDRIKHIFQNDIHGILNCFTKLLGIRIVIFSRDGQMISTGANSSNCHYCQLLRERLGFEDKCRALDHKMQLESTQKKKVISYECHGGMIESVIPLFVAGELVGYGMIGQFRTSDKLPIKIQKRWDKMACGEDLAQAYQKAPVFEQERLDYIVQLFEIFADFIVHHRMVTSKEYNNFDTLLMYMDEHPAENLSLAQAADIACRSKSTFSHTFKTLMGKSFKQYQIQMKLARADEYFQQRPDITIREVAYKLGYEDPLYFSKLYHKNRGVSPVTNRKKKR